MANSISSWLFGRPRIVVENAREDDFHYLAKIHKEGFARGWSDGEFEALLSQQAFACLVARKARAGGSYPVGFVVTKTVEDESEIITIAVTKNWRGNGIARQLMDAAIRKLQADRVASLFLEVDETNKAAIALYKKLGFSSIGQRESYYRQRPDTNASSAAALVMLRELG